MMSTASPHTRGWTRRMLERVQGRAGFPAHAGMDPHPDGGGGGGPWLPRTRGDGPSRFKTREHRSTASPHTRGWTAGGLVRQWRGYGFPAHAGMDPADAVVRHRGHRLPRTRGDGPRATDPDPAGTPASPHTRGWTPFDDLIHVPRTGFPAHAGMDPGCRPPTPSGTWLPRTRGDGPQRVRQVDGPDAGFPAHAGMDRFDIARHGPATGLPRTRGDGPGHVGREDPAGVASPHTRGWTRRRPIEVGRDCGFPAHAGMDPAIATWTSRTDGLPRTRGDGPLYTIDPATAQAASPHTRGWTRPPLSRGGARGGFPAHAGMDPTAGSRQRHFDRLPRTRGDGPEPKTGGSPEPPASPHTRGWT